MYVGSEAVTILVVFSPLLISFFISIYFDFWRRKKSY